MKNILLELIKEKKFNKLKEELIKLNPVTISEIISEVPTREEIIIYRLLPKELAVRSFSYLESEEQLRLITSFSKGETTELIDELFFDDLIDLIEEMPANIVTKLLQVSTVENRKKINQFLSYPEESAGSLMTTEYLSLKEDMSISEALKHIRSTGKTSESIYTAYITDKSIKLLGVLSLRSIILAELDQKISDIYKSDDIVTVNTLDDQEIIADKFKKYDLISIPVVDLEGRLTGIITIDDIVEVIEEENTEDMQKMAAINPLTDKYMDVNSLDMAKKRIPWLLILMISASFTSGVIGKYEHTLALLPILNGFIPLLMDTAGNSGAQTSTLVIRELSLGNISLGDWLKIMIKEFKVSFLVALILSIINFLRLYYLEITLFGRANKLEIAFVVSATLFFTVVLAKLVGAILPLGAQKLKFDPALMAGPLITTIVDVLALVVYFHLITTFMPV
ncbi:magnesium transporter [Fusobacteria bacterium ZRK30]|nr:magnesium transporter [Fusobacteria bacterium ZRK30]